ncbi:MAG: hypothetical protein MJZ72_06060 [Bacteroidales bacterium]|nr:hypothetical protein [Bacteroidales bacterium]
MKNTFKSLFLVALTLLLATGTMQAERWVGDPAKRAKAKAGSAKCLSATNSNELTINNVRAYIETNGTMWNRNSLAQYEVPQGSKKSSMFAAALWIGGLDDNNQLKLAAVRFRQVGDDFWTGPLSVDGLAQIAQEDCAAWDKMFKMTRAEVDEHINTYNTHNHTVPNPSLAIRNWPAHGDYDNKNQSFYLAPFKDVNGNFEYDPENGDYPYYDIDNELCPWTEANKSRAAHGLLPVPYEQERVAEFPLYANSIGIDGMVYADHVLKGDETLFWIFNDKGNAHTETGGEAIGLEIRAQAFAFQTNDDLNNMTFYSYEIINRSTTNLNQTYFSQWADPDLGYSHDDYVGCDVARGLGYCYNGSSTDGAGLAQHYGANPPAVGVDFFQGPYIDPDYEVDDSTGEMIGRDNPYFDMNLVGTVGTVANKLYCDQFLKSEYTNDQFAINGVNFGDSIANNERFGMRRFVFHNNDNTDRGDPGKATEYYQMLRGIWKDGTRMRYGALGHPNFGGLVGPECDFMFPGTSDPCNWGVEDPAQRDVFNYQDYGGSRGWVEETVVGNQPGDRRFMQSAGPFTLRRGAVNYITVGIPWARSFSGGAWESVELLKIADDKCQALFENCFKVLDGPDAPDVTIKEYENELIIYLTNDRDDSNNKDESYSEVDPQISAGYTTDSLYMQKFYRTDPEDPTHLILDSVMAVASVYKQYPEGSNKYNFEGYQIYQVAGTDVSVSDLGDADKVRLVAQCDVVNYRPDGTAIGQLINWEFDQSLNTNVAVEKVNGANTGIQRTFRITEDLFATGANKSLVNHKTYYFMVIAYAYNEFAPFSIDEQVQDGLKGQKTPYLAGRRNIKVVSAVPHSPKATGVDVSKLPAYGTQPKITRVEGQGNGGFVLELDDETKAKILRGGDNGDYTPGNVTYKSNYGPINVSIIDPLQVKPLNYEVKFVKNGEEVNADTRWVLAVTGVDGVSFSSQEELYAYLKDTFNITKPVDTSNFSISVATEQLFMELGISVGIKDVPFTINDDQQLTWHTQCNGGSEVSAGGMMMAGQVKFLGSSLSFTNDANPWILGQVDAEGEYPSNWIRSGIQASGSWEEWSNQDGAENEYMVWRNEDACEIYPPNGEESPYTTQSMRAFKDPINQYETINYGTWAPYVITSPYSGGIKASFFTPDTVYYAVNAGCPQPRCYDFAEIIKTSAYTDYLPLDGSGHDISHTSTKHNQYALGTNMTMTNLYSVDVVYTSDKSLWTRCLVLEAGSDPSGFVTVETADGQTVQNVRHEPKKNPSVDKNGNIDGTGTTGFGWFPGYAINIETGERLNIMFAENSLDSINNGNDMIFNPTTNYAHYIDPETDSLILLNEAEYQTLWDHYAMMDHGIDSPHAIHEMPEPAFGGRHYLYICSSSGNTAPIEYEDKNAKRNYNDNDQKRPGAGNLSTSGAHTNYQHGTQIRDYVNSDAPVTDAQGNTYNYYECGPYDECEWLAAKFRSIVNDSNLNRPQRRAVKMQIFNNVMWASIPMPYQGFEDKWLQPGNDATVKIRVSRPYMRYKSRWYSEEQRAEYEMTHGAFQNEGFPLYTFSTADLAPVINRSQEYCDEILKDINIVPNPYYGFSSYESTALETYVKIVNVPAPCEISIYTANGTLIRTLSKKDSESATTYVDWDLKNHANIPIAGGVYIIHVKAPGIGERTLKFFCTMRPTDLNAF